MVKNSISALCALTACVLLLIAGAARAQQTCLHDASESQAEKARRQSALGAARFINTVQAIMFSRDGAYKPLSDFATSPYVRDSKTGKVYKDMTFDKSEVLPGFEARLSTDGKTYSFLITDKTDPCRFTYSSDTQGVIYEGHVIR